MLLRGRSARALRARHASCSALAWLALASAACERVGAQDPRAVAPSARVEAPTVAREAAARAAGVWVELERVVDADTLWVRRDGQREKLRLACVDAEEKISANGFESGKPQTVYGHESAAWLRELLAPQESARARTRLRLVFPGAREQRDLYGRLLCHVELADGRDLNLLLVRAGRSPYFNKYGNSELAHADFVRAQEQARSERIGIWDPATNAPATEGAAAARRDYERLLPWWDARAQAVDALRARRAAGEPLFEIEDPAELERAAAWSREQRATALCFGSPERSFDEADGSLTLLMRGPEQDARLRVRVPRSVLASAAVRALKLESRTRSDCQNYLWVRGALRPSPRGGYELEAALPSSIELAGPEPVFPRRARSR
jgi:endonuclease YncB( thermonuclease family)